MEMDPRFRSLVAHFKDKIPWEMTELFQDVMERINLNDEHWHHCKSREDVIRRCQYLDNLFRFIESVGYKTQNELFGRGLKGYIGRRSARVIPETNEIQVNIGRTGKLLFVNGIHRLAIVYSIEITVIPVNVLIRHELWQQLRDKIGGNKKRVDSNLYNHHPDLCI